MIKNVRDLKLDDIKHVGVSFVSNDCRKSGKTYAIVSDLRLRLIWYITDDLEIRSSSEKGSFKILKNKSNKYKRMEFEKIQERIKEVINNDKKIE